MNLISLRKDIWPYSRLVDHCDVVSAEETRPRELYRCRSYVPGCQLVLQMVLDTWTNKVSAGAADGTGHMNKQSVSWCRRWYWTWANKVTMTKRITRKLIFICSCLSNRHQFVSIGNSKSPISPHGSVLGPILFSLYISPIAEIASAHGLSQQQYADDTQLYVAITKSNLSFDVQKLEQCLSCLHTWFCFNEIALNSDKTDAIIFGISRTLPSLTSIDVAGCTVPVSSDVKIVGVSLDSVLSLNKHVGFVSKACYYHIQALRHIRKSLTDDFAKSIACAIVGSRFDCANAVLIGVSAFNIKKLQRVQNTLARIVTRQYSYAGTSKSLTVLHWLPIKWRVDLKVAIISYKLLSNGQSFYLASSISLHAHGRSLMSSDSGSLYVPRTKLVIGERAFRSAAPTV